MVLLYEDTNLTKLSWWEKNFLFMNEAEFNQKNTLKEYLTNSPKWKLIYADNIAAVYIKK